LLNTNAENAPKLIWRREWDSNPPTPFAVYKLQSPHCQQCQECHRCRRPFARDCTLGLSAAVAGPATIPGRMPMIRSPPHGWFPMCSRRRTTAIMERPRTKGQSLDAADKPALISPADDDMVGREDPHA
jgi:hypothetical protein